MDKNRWNANMKKKYRSREGEPARGYHSLAYHRHFEGYEERKVKDANGHEHIERVYVGTRYQRDLSSGKEKLFIALYWIFFVLAVGVFAFSGTRSIAVNSTWYGAVSETLSILALIWTLVVLFNYCTVPTQMTIGDFKSSSRSLKICTYACMITLFLNSFCTFLSLVFDQSNVKMTLVAGCLYLAGILFAFLINRMEYAVKYIEIPYTGDHDREASEIQA